MTGKISIGFLLCLIINFVPRTTLAQGCDGYGENKTKCCLDLKDDLTVQYNANVSPQRKDFLDDITKRKTWTAPLKLETS